jgi:Fe-S oxidoreductase
VLEHLRKEDNMLMKPKAERGKWTDGLKVKDLTREKADIVFHAGCKASLSPELWPVIRGAVDIIRSTGADVGVMGREEACCGGRVYEMGYKGEFTKYAENNIQAWSNAGVKTVVTSCADGYYAFKRLYPECGSKIEVLHILEFIERSLQEGRLKLRKEIQALVTYHDPCHIGRRLPEYVPGEPIVGLYEEPRNIIKSIPGMKLIEMERIKEYAWCCGAGGGAREAYPDFNLYTAKERIEEAEATGASYLVTSCPWCENSFQEAVTACRSRIKIIDIVELVLQAL